MSGFFFKFFLHYLLSIFQYLSICRFSFSFQFCLKSKLCFSNISTLVLKKSNSSQCLKITEKVAFNIASEASNVYILSGQNRQITFNWKKLMKNAKIQITFVHSKCNCSLLTRNVECDFFCDFPTVCRSWKNANQ